MNKTEESKIYYYQPRPFSEPYASVIIGNNEYVLTIWRSFAYVLVTLIIILDFFEFNFDFFLYYHHWSLTAIFISFGMLLSDSVIKLAPLGIRSIFIWWKSLIVDDIINHYKLLKEIWDNGYGKLSDQELFETWFQTYHDINAYIFQLAYAQEIMSMVFYWSFLHKWF